ncbi:ISL3 family transposase [Streptomyces sp. TRM68367]|uniref:ISL3 family transposase n=1 Tax=Streptomyces sp. TRM68367 TaxID=2758415 RepID=UPI0021CF4AE1|nr:ISL3 family transposase [Streptomyces sp. TRM68367]
MESDGVSVTLSVRSSVSVAACSGCGSGSSRVHGRYRRSLADSPVAGRGAKIVVTVRRFKCVNDACSQTTFSEQVPGLTMPFARRTPTLTKALVSIALALAGRAGSRLATQLGMPCGRDLLIKLIRKQPAPQVPAVTVLGVDDFAIRRRHSYNTILIDMETHRPIDVLPDREAQTLADWLTRHPGVKIVCRDRGGAYAEGVRAGAPDALQVADRFHLWKNLCEAAQKTVVAHHGCLRQAVRAEAEVQSEEHTAPLQITSPPSRDYPLAARTRQRHADVQECLARGLSRAAVSRELNLDIQTVRRFADAATAEELLAKAEHRVSRLDPWRDVVNQCWNAGVTNAQDITAELRLLGFTGSVQIVRRYLRPLRPHGDGRKRGPGKSAPTTPAIPKPRQVSRWMLTHPDHLDEDDALGLITAVSSCEHLERLHNHIRTFAAIMTQRRGADLLAWLDTVDADDLPALQTLATGLRRDLDAVINGLTLEHNSGVVEGAVTRIKALKRQCYGRANFDLLRLRILLTP